MIMEMRDEQNQDTRRHCRLGSQSWRTVKSEQNLEDFSQLPRKRAAAAALGAEMIKHLGSARHESADRAAAKAAMATAKGQFCPPPKIFVFLAGKVAGTLYGLNPGVH